MTISTADTKSATSIGRSIIHNEPALEIVGAVKRFHKEGQRRAKGRAPREELLAVNQVSLRVGRGEIFGLLGANGSGKSTLIRLVSTLLLPDAGQVRVFGHDVQREERTVRRLINRVSVEASFLNHQKQFEKFQQDARYFVCSI